jgi:SAM-dependent methyltransferase
VAGYLDDNREVARCAPRFENAIGMCGTCHLVQQMNDDAKPMLSERVYAAYQRTYSMSKRVSSYLEGFIADALCVAGAVAGDSVIEIGSNDGSLLHLVANGGYRAFGFDPSAADDESECVQVVRDFFTAETAASFADRKGAVKLVVSRHTLEHAFDPLDFFHGVRMVLSAGGCALVEVPYVVHQMMNNQFQSFTFQHVSFFSVHSMVAIASRAGLSVEDVRFVEMDGGSMVVTLRRVEDQSHVASATRSLLSLERTLGYGTPDPYADYFRTFARERTRIHEVLDTMIDKGTSVVGYGAGSKGQAMVNMLELGPDRLIGVIDDTPGAAGKFVPGTALPVISRNEVAINEGTCIFVTAPTHAKEIVARQRQECNGPVYLGTTPRFCWL